MPDVKIETSNELDFLTPEQRLNAIAGILSKIALRAVNSSHKVEANIGKVLESASSGQAVGALWDMLNERAFRLKFERDPLLIEQRRLKEQVTPAEIGVDDHALRTRLQSLEIIRKAAEPEELQRLLRLMVRRVEWSPQGKHKAQLYVLLTKNQKPADSKSRQAAVIHWCVQRYPVGDSNP